MKENGMPRYPQVVFGEDICHKLHRLFTQHVKWENKISNRIARIFSDVKREAKFMFPNDDETEMLRKISRYTEADFKELCEICKIQDKEVLRGTVEDMGKKE